MTKYLLAAAAVVALSTAAFAGDNKPVQMTDAQMDQVTAGVGPGFGVLTASGHTLNAGHSEFGRAKAIDRSGQFVGAGRCTAGQVVCLSDIRLKRDIKQVARLDNGLALYRYRYKWSDQVYVGVMAQEVALVRPDAVSRGADGYLRVDYSCLGLHLMTWEEWLALRLFKTAESATAATTGPKVMSDAEMEGVTAGAGPFNYGGLVSGQGNQGKLSDAAIANGFKGQGVHHAERP